MVRQAYPSDLSDSQWETLQPLIPAPKPGPQEVKYERREIVNAMLYEKRTGCQWRFLPHDFPPGALYKSSIISGRKTGLLSASSLRSANGFAPKLDEPKSPRL